VVEPTTQVLMCFILSYYRVRLFGVKLQVQAL